MDAATISKKYSNVFDTEDGLFVLADLCEAFNYFAPVNTTLPAEQIALAAAEKNPITFIHDRLCLGENTFQKIRQNRINYAKEALKYDQ